MAVYVDTMAARYGRMIMCHMIADTTEELLAMADLIGVSHRYIQHPGTYREHFDISLTKKALAIANGAIVIDMHELAAKLHARRPLAPERPIP